MDNIQPLASPTATSSKTVVCETTASVTAQPHTTTTTTLSTTGSMQTLQTPRRLPNPKNNENEVETFHSPVQNLSWGDMMEQNERWDTVNHHLLLPPSNGSAYEKVKLVSQEAQGLSSRSQMPSLTQLTNGL